MRRTFARASGIILAASVLCSAALADPGNGNRVGLWHNPHAVVTSPTVFPLVTSPPVVITLDPAANVADATAVTGLEPRTLYQESWRVVDNTLAAIEPTGYGCNTGTGTKPSNGSGVYHDVGVGWDAITCAGFPGLPIAASGDSVTVTFWLRAGTSTDFNDAPVALSGGGVAFVSVTFTAP